ncbi:hypothetical protein ANO14919_077470 [Xylariales sp. No.14919]|nr:hypothetical protein ANO14919_077470 [Xylariales sp. No.14919]
MQLAASTIPASLPCNCLFADFFLNFFPNPNAGSSCYCVAIENEKSFQLWGKCVFQPQQ